MTRQHTHLPDGHRAQYSPFSARNRAIGRRSTEPYVVDTAVAPTTRPTLCGGTYTFIDDVDISAETPIQRVNIERRLWDSLETMESTFEQPEAFLVLAQRRNSVMRPSNLQALCTILVKWLRTWEGNSASEDDVFACNWQMQCLHALAVHKITMGPVQKSLYTRLLCRLLSCSTTYDTRTETNYLAVAFEGLCAALGVLKQMDGHEGTQIRLAVQGVLLPLLHTRFSQPHGVYCFTNGAARLDITGHVLSGYRYMLHYARQTRAGKSTRKKIHRKPRVPTHHRH